MENAVFLYISTDYVFDGKRPPYKENDEPNPLNQYGKTKLEGEKEVMNVKPDSCILRIPVLYGDEEYIGESAVSSLIKNLKQPVPTKLSNAEIRFPSHTNDIASIIFQLMQCKLKDMSLNSVFHWCGLEPFTKYEMAKIIAEEFSISFSHIIPDETPSSAPRPKNVELSCDRLKKLGISQHTVFRDGIRQSFRKFFEETEL
ncbi:methionine adenosyltransferase 2 subunit beta-like [Stegodyphus dumicola]|uniref:methionine adenosyltransferase 2 subunit beta-like n=1 Tax=Stegodyphus dumicola TaxID=202533 RepID=UPI0015AF1479|nr:methionine adenosyltransferase 2 subunit beta-like [Stegodyphus dumicola]